MKTILIYTVTILSAVVVLYKTMPFVGYTLTTTSTERAANIHKAYYTEVK